jgi:hypothetical protein
LCCSKPTPLGKHLQQGIGIHGQSLAGANLKKSVEQARGHLTHSHLDHSPLFTRSTNILQIPFISDFKCRMPRHEYSTLQISLRGYWPLGRMAKKDLKLMQSSAAAVTHYHPDLRAFEVKQRDGRSLEKTRIFVPLRYVNPLRLLNAKIAFFATVLDTCWTTRAKDDTKEGLQKLTDAMGRNLWFECQIRSQFFTELEQEFYGGRGADGKQPHKSIGDDDFFSQMMDSWLREEFFLDGVHNPVELSRQIAEQTLDAGDCHPRPSYLSTSLTPW